PKFSKLSHPRGQVRDERTHLDGESGPRRGASVSREVILTPSSTRWPRSRSSRPERWPEARTRSVSTDAQRGETASSQTTATSHESHTRSQVPRGGRT